MNVDSAVTLGHQLELEDAIESLPTVDRCWYDVLLAAQAEVETIDPAQALARATHVVAIDTLCSRPRIFASASAPDGYAAALHLRAPAALEAAHAALYEQRRARSADGAARARQWILELPPDQLQSRISYLCNTMAHAGPVIVFVEEQLFSNIYDNPNLMGGAVRPGSSRCALTRLPSKPAESWDPAEIRLFYSLTMVAAIGPTSLLKELNFCQLGYWEVRGHLLRRLHYWTSLNPELRAPEIDESLTPSDLVPMLSALRNDGIARPRSVGYRIVNGRSFKKVEQRMQYAPPVGAGRPHYERVAAAEPEKRAALAFSLLFEVLGKALEVTRSSYVLSRGVRNYRLFTELCAQGDFETVMDWEPNRFFCFVLQRSPAGDGAVILRSISERMRYNTWHFLPDTLRELGAQPPASRDYFFAPKSPDLSFHEDHVHAGHVQARVKFAMRFPMPVTVLGKSLKGLADLRLARSEAPSYTPTDLASAFSLADEVLQIHQALADFRLARSLDAPDYKEKLSAHGQHT